MTKTTEILKEFEKKHCRCTPDYKDRDLFDPQCQVHDLIPEFKQALQKQREGIVNYINKGLKDGSVEVVEKGLIFHRKAKLKINHD